MGEPTKADIEKARELSAARLADVQAEMSKSKSAAEFSDWLVAYEEKWLAQALADARKEGAAEKEHGDGH